MNLVKLPLWPFIAHAFSIQTLTTLGLSTNPVDPQGWQSLCDAFPRAVQRMHF